MEKSIEQILNFNLTNEQKEALLGALANEIIEKRPDSWKDKNEALKENSRKQANDVRERVAKREREYSLDYEINKMEDALIELTNNRGEHIYTKENLKDLSISELEELYYRYFKEHRLYNVYDKHYGDSNRKDVSNLESNAINNSVDIVEEQNENQVIEEKEQDSEVVEYNFELPVQNNENYQEVSPITISEIPEVVDNNEIYQEIEQNNQVIPDSNNDIVPEIEVNNSVLTPQQEKVLPGNLVENDKFKSTKWIVNNPDKKLAGWKFPTKVEEFNLEPEKNRVVTKIFTAGKNLINSIKMKMQKFIENKRQQKEVDSEYYGKSVIEYEPTQDKFFNEPIQEAENQQIESNNEYYGNSSIEYEPIQENEYQETKIYDGLNRKGM